MRVASGAAVCGNSSPHWDQAVESRAMAHTVSSQGHSPRCQITDGACILILCWVQSEAGAAPGRYPRVLYPLWETCSAPGQCGGLDIRVGLLPKSAFFQPGCLQEGDGRRLTLWEGLGLRARPPAILTHRCQLGFRSWSQA